MNFLQFNDVVVVSGCGPIGLGMVVGAKLKSPKVVIALDVLDWKVGTRLYKPNFLQYELYLTSNRVGTARKSSSYVTIYDNFQSKVSALALTSNCV